MTKILAVNILGFTQNNMNSKGKLCKILVSQVNVLFHLSARVKCFVQKLDTRCRVGIKVHVFLGKNNAFQVL